MKFIFENNPKFPKLAWLAEIRTDGVAKVMIGERVEHDEKFFVEGAWSDEYSKMNFPYCEWFCGSGAVIEEDKFVFSSPTGMHAALYICENDEEGFLISNSMPCIMAAKGFELDPKYLGYDVMFNNNILQGIYKYNPNIHVVKKGCGGQLPSGTLKMILYRNIIVSKEGNIEICIKNDTKGFKDFEDYYNRLLVAMKLLASNASDNSRRYKYGVTSLISSGYDSACCSAIAKEVGATKALTFSAKGKYSEDSGKNAAQYLGFEELVERDAYAYKNRDDFPEVKSISSGDLGVQISFSTFEDEFRNNLVFSGENGDFIWCKTKGFQTINDEYHIVWRNSEIGLSEVHLHQCFIPVPMTSYGIRHWTDTYRISNSEEMKNWSIGGDYDRPIPRRILEEKGLPRESFGMKKYGAGFYYVYDWKKRLLSRLSEKSATEFEDYIKKHKSNAPISSFLRFAKANYKNYWNALMAKLKLDILTLKISDDEVEKIFTVPNPMAARYLIPWATNHMVKEYEESMR